MDRKTDQRLLVITPDDKVLTMPYTGRSSLMEAVYGYPEFCGTETVPVDARFSNGKEELPIITYCSRSIIISNDKRFEKINAAASLMMEKEIRGNLAILIDEGQGMARGFEYKEKDIAGIITELPCECLCAKNAIRSFISEFFVHIKECHEQFDNKKEISAGEFIALKAIEMSV